MGFRNLKEKLKNVFLFADAILLCPFPSSVGYGDAMFSFNFKEILKFSWDFPRF